MKFNEYISTHHVFSTGELLSACDSPASAKQQLWLAAKSGKVEKVRRGVYASFFGRFQGSIPDPFEVASACDRSAVVCYHSALAVLGVAHSAGFQCDFLSHAVKSPFAYRGVNYVPHAPRADAATTAVRAGDGPRIPCTSKEQTIIDCMDKPWLAGGAEEVVRSLTLFAYVDLAALAAMLDGRGAPSRARVGWLLESMCDAWHVDGGALEALRASLGEGPYRFGRPRTGSSGWSPSWKLLLPEPNEEVESWISG